MHTGGGPLSDTAFGIGTPLLAAVLWGLFAAPRATFSVPAAKVAVQWRPSAQPPLALYATSHRALAVAFAVLVVTNSILVRR